MNNDVIELLEIFNSGVDPPFLKEVISDTVGKACDAAPREIGVIQVDSAPLHKSLHERHSLDTRPIAQVDITHADFRRFFTQPLLPGRTCEEKVDALQPQRRIFNERDG